jgi:DNA repair protein RAD50
MEWQTKFEERIALLETKISKLGREMDDEGATSSSLIEKTKHVACDIAKLQAEADVILFFLFPLLFLLLLLPFFCQTIFVIT